MKDMNLKYVVLSIIGTHAGKTKEKILDEKIGHVKSYGKTFWLYHSNKYAEPAVVQQLSLKAKKENKSVYTVFIAGGADPTIGKDIVKKYSINGKNNWEKIPEEISPVTGRIAKTTHAFVFNQLKIMDDEIELFDYAVFPEQNKPIRFNQAVSTLCAVKKDTSGYLGAMKTHNRKIIAVGKLCHPFCVYLRK